MEQKKTTGNRFASGGRTARRGRPERREPAEFEQQILDIARVTRVTAGGKRMRFRVCIVIGDKKGRVGVGVAKGADVASGVDKAVHQAKRRLIRVPIKNETLPFGVSAKYGAAKVMFKPAPRGAGLKAGGAARAVLELAGVGNAVTKALGSKNKINNARAAILALKQLK